MEYLGLVILLFPVIIVIVGAIGGWIQDGRHERSLAQREPAVAGVVLTDLRSPPVPVDTTVTPELVSGAVVIAVDRGKQIIGLLRNLVGGEVRSYQKVLTRARREAIVRMQEDALRQRADLVVNFRLETSDVGGIATEILAYGTALKRSA